MSIQEGRKEQQINLSTQETPKLSLTLRRQGCVLVDKFNVRHRRIHPAQVLPFPQPKNPEEKYPK